METKFNFIKLSVGHVFLFLYSSVFDIVHEHTGMVQSMPTIRLELCHRVENILNTVSFLTWGLVTFNLSAGIYCGTCCPSKKLFYTRPMLTGQTFYAIFQCLKKSHENCLEAFITFFELINLCVY